MTRSCPARRTGRPAADLPAAPRAAVLVTGDEILRGRTPERDAAIIARSLDAMGVAMDRVLVVGDALPALVAALGALLAEGLELVVVTGGLGPTHDDLTMEAVARATSRPLELHEGALALVRRGSTGVAGDGETARRAAEKQASLPRGATPLPPAGTAPGCLLAHGSSVVCVLPGPPWELEAMWRDALGTAPLADLLARARPPRERVLRLHGVPEQRLVAALRERPPGTLEGISLGICAAEGELELTVRTGPGAGAGADALEDALEVAFGAALYSRDGRDAVAVVAEALTARGEALAVAESCTGGGLGARITARAGASAWFHGGVISYDDRVKRELLGVPAEVLARHGAVSAECARAMADGVRRRIGVEWALSITGVAGPGGGSAAKPIGLVHIGLATPGGTATHEHHLRGDREAVRGRSAALALHHLRRALAGEERPAEREA